MMRSKLALEFGNCCSRQLLKRQQPDYLRVHLNIITIAHFVVFDLKLIHGDAVTRILIEIENAFNTFEAVITVSHAEKISQDRANN